MIPLHLFLRAEDMRVDLPDGQIIDAGDVAGGLRIGGLAKGTQGGKPTVSFLVPLPDGRYVFTQTTLALLLTAVEALKAVHGDPRS